MSSLPFAAHYILDEVTKTSSLLGTNPIPIGKDDLNELLSYDTSPIP